MEKRKCTSVSSVKAEVLTFCSSGAFRCVLTQWKGEKTLAAIVGEVHHFIVRTSSFKTAANLYRSGPPPQKNFKLQLTCLRKHVKC